MILKSNKISLLDLGNYYIIECLYENFNSFFDTFSFD